MAFAQAFVVDVDGVYTSVVLRGRARTTIHTGCAPMVRSPPSLIRTSEAGWLHWEGDLRCLRAWSFYAVSQFSLGIYSTRLGDPPPCSGHDVTRALPPHDNVDTFSTTPSAAPLPSGSFYRSQCNLRLGQGVSMRGTWRVQ